MQALPVFDLILFGGTGDLAMRKLLPALYRRAAAGQITKESRIIGAARSELSPQDYLAQVEESCRKHVGADFDPTLWAQFAELVTYVKIDVHAEADFHALNEMLKGRENVIRSTADHGKAVVMTATTAVPGTAGSTTGVGIMTSITDMRRTGITGRMTAVFMGILGLAILAAIIRTRISRGTGMFRATDIMRAMATAIPTMRTTAIMDRAALRPTACCSVR